MADLPPGVRDVRRHDSDRFLCALFAPAEERVALWALLAVNHEIARIREAVREPMLGRMRLEWWRQAIEDALGGEPLAHEVLGPLVSAARRFRLDLTPLERLLDGRASDLEERPFADGGALRSYAEATSATLCGLWLDVLGVADQDVRRAACNIGVAWAMVGIMRSIPQQVEAGRWPLPEDLRVRAGFDPSASEPDQRAALAKVVEQVARLAVAELAAAERLAPRPPARGRPVFLQAALAQFYLERLRRAGHDPFRATVAGRGPARVLRLIRAAATGSYYPP